MLESNCIDFPQHWFGFQHVDFAGHMYDLEIIDVKDDRYGTSEWFKADMQWFTILVARQDKRFK